MVVSGIGTFGGLMGGLAGSMGWGALGVAFGASSGLIFGSCGPFSLQKEIEKIDQELTTSSGIFASHIDSFLLVSLQLCRPKFSH